MSERRQTLILAMLAMNLMHLTHGWQAVSWGFLAAAWAVSGFFTKDTKATAA